MITVFTWTGFVCLTAAIIALTYIVVVAILDIAVQRTKVLNRLFKRLTAFYDTMPKKEFHHRFAITLYDFEKGTFEKTALLADDFMTDEEYDRQRQLWREEYARKK